MNFDNKRWASILLVGSNISQDRLMLCPEEDSQMLNVAVALLSNLIFYILGTKTTIGNPRLIILGRKLPLGDRHKWPSLPLSSN